MSNQRRQLFLINTLFDLQRLGRSSHKSFSAVHLYRHRYYIYIYICHACSNSHQTDNIEPLTSDTLSQSDLRSSEAL